MVFLRRGEDGDTIKGTDLYWSLLDEINVFRGVSDIMIEIEKLFMASRLERLIFFLTNESNWCRFAYHKNKGFCILGAISFLFKGKEISETKEFLIKELPIFIQSNKLNVNTGQNPLNLATFNDSVPHLIVLLFLRTTINKLRQEIDNTNDEK